MAPPKRRALPKPLPDGFILTDTEKKKWRLGKIIGQGGFGLIYLGNESILFIKMPMLIQIGIIAPSLFLLDTLNTFRAMHQS